MPQTETISREQYNRLRKHGYAGTKSELKSDWWSADHWMLKLIEGQGTCLVPVEVER